MAKQKSKIRISDLSKHSGVTPRTIRFYIQEGLLPEPERKQRNLALYDVDCIEKIKSIKKAQTERFLPLVVIRKILEQTHFNYSALDDVDLPAFSESNLSPDRECVKLDKLESKFPDDILSTLTRRKLVHLEEHRKGLTVCNSDDRRLLSLLSTLRDNGLSWEVLISSMETIRKAVENIAEIECQALLSGVMTNPARDYHKLLLLEEKALQGFINKIRHNALKNAVTRFKSDLDYAFLASADEGYAVQASEIMPYIREIEQSLNPRAKDKRVLNDLALAYSCLGNLEHSLRFLRRIRKFAPEDLETQFRWIWYRRFAKRRGDQNRLKRELEHLVKANPTYAMGRAFMAVWHSFDLLEADDPYDALRITNHCLQELEAADHYVSEDLHDWTLIHYIKGNLYGWLHVSPENLGQGVAAFECILARQAEINNYYAEQKPFFVKWLWPNFYLFLGTTYNQAGRYKEAARVLRRGRDFNMLPPYRERLENEIKKAEAGNT